MTQDLKLFGNVEACDDVLLNWICLLVGIRPTQQFGYNSKKLTIFTEGAHCSSAKLSSSLSIFGAHLKTIQIRMQGNKIFSYLNSSYSTKERVMAAAAILSHYCSANIRTRSPDTFYHFYGLCFLVYACVEENLRIQPSSQTGWDRQ